MAAIKGNEKLIEEISNMSVLELSELVKALEEKFGVSAAAPVAVAGAAPAAGGDAPAAEAKTEFKVTLQGGGDEKIKVIKALRSVKKDLGLADAKKAVEEAPYVVAEGVSKEDAEKMKKELEAAGATVELS